MTREELQRRIDSTYKQLEPEERNAALLVVACELLFDIRERLDRTFVARRPHGGGPR